MRVLLPIDSTIAIIINAIRALRARTGLAVPCLYILAFCIETSGIFAIRDSVPIVIETILTLGCTIYLAMVLRIRAPWIGHIDESITVIIALVLALSLRPIGLLFCLARTGAREIGRLTAGAVVVDAPVSIVIDTIITLCRSARLGCVVYIHTIEILEVDSSIAIVINPIGALIHDLIFCFKDR